MCVCHLTQIAYHVTGKHDILHMRVRVCMCVYECVRACVYVIRHRLHIMSQEDTTSCTCVSVYVCACLCTCVH
jgi:hypothetical protein